MGIENKRNGNVCDGQHPKTPKTCPLNSPKCDYLVLLELTFGHLDVTSIL